MKKMLLRYFLLLVFIFLETSSYANSVRYIIDTDMGFDDWMAVLYLLKQPVTIDAITIDCLGETRCPQGAMHASQLTHLAKRDVPIAPGYWMPDSKYNFPKAIRDYASNMSVPGFTHLKMDNDIQKISAAQLILNYVIYAAKKHEKVMIISIGTAANIADAWQLAIKSHQVKLFRQGLGMIYKGGGAFGKINHHHLTNQNIPGNIPIPKLMKSDNTVSEWNIYADAPAMQMLVNANLPITFIPNNASDQVPMTQKRYNALVKAGVTNPTDRFDANALLTLVPNGNWHKMAGMDFWDTAATVSALHPQIVTTVIKHVPIEIITEHNNDYAATWVSPQSKHYVTVYDHLNKKMFYQFLNITG